ncbi:ETS domain-containing protein ets-7 [Caenorhabditis elegans]|uniref:ETS domain-containing protein ets-7 n=1 Tax=Caenorhabditis elegans TaxID=6239 RepID=ETS7_CAEEL|nr:ETS domain-containing protein ets-7 [Caenorhabditis elegans]O01519.2 RecName: Full=ETS domain-containing protein ets-7; AltName: Full=ETS class transcription factor ets-7 [Caenorhabditis elegans]CCD67764.1 ETS domain-containing protein ets-7 [Caenorhabditis elegans]|eukprot:NP_504947.2 ETS class transcription factor [Caenorhabditis elegans]
MSSKRTSPNGKQRLLNFLRGLLEDDSHSDLITWSNKDTLEFQMLKPHKVAELWGAATGNPGMNYDKMSRGLRYFYTNNTLKKVKGKDSRYCFLDTPLLAPFPDFFPKANEPMRRVPLFSIENLLASSEETTSNFSLQSSPSSSSNSSSARTMSATSSPTSSLEDVINPPVLIDPFQMQMAHITQTFLATQLPALQAFPMQLQLQFLKTLLPTLFPNNN